MTSGGRPDHDAGLLFGYAGHLYARDGGPPEIVLGIPLTFSIADGIALGLIAYPAVKLCGGKPREAHWLMYLLALLLVAYFFARSWAG